MIKRHLKNLLIASGFTVLPIPIGLMLWNQLPDRMPSHWGVSGQADNYLPKAACVFGFPLLMLALFWLCLFVTTKDPKSKNQNSKAFGATVWLMPLISCVVSGIMYAASMGMAMDVSVIVGLLFAVMFVTIGNYMPKCKQNLTLGIKIRPTLESEENWNATHRLAGKIWFFGGFAMFPCMFLPDAAALVCMLSLTAVMVFVPVVFSYVYRRRQLANDQNDLRSLEEQPFMKKVKFISLGLIAVILIGCTVLMFTGDVTATVGDEALDIRATYWSDASVPFAEIDSVEYYESFAVGTRTYGFASSRLLLGSFQSEELGAYTLYAYSPCKSAIVIRDGDHVLAVGCKTAEETKALYEQLKEAVA